MTERDRHTEAMSRLLDNLETLLTAIRQRPDLTVDQLDRYAKLLEHAERDALRRLA